MGRKRTKPFIDTTEKTATITESDSCFFQRHVLHMQTVSTDTMNEEKVCTALDAINTSDYEIQFASNGKSKYTESKGSANSREFAESRGSANSREFAESRGSVISQREFAESRGSVISQREFAESRESSGSKDSTESKDSVKELSDMTIHEHICIRLPLRLQSSYWNRHGLSLPDIHQTIDCTSTIHIWQLALVEKLSISTSSVRIRHSSQTTISYAGKANAISKLMKIYQERYKERSSWKSCLTWPETEALDLTSVQTRNTLYPFPIHYVRPDTFAQLSHIYESVNYMDKMDKSTDRSSDSVEDIGHVFLQATSPMVTTWLGQSIRCYSHIICWRDIVCIPYRIDKPSSNTDPESMSLSQPGRIEPTMILMVRIVPWKSYVHVYGLPNVLAQAPDMVMVRQTKWCVLDESF
jgi:hypothetical protein